MFPTQFLVVVVGGLRGRQQLVVAGGRGSAVLWRQRGHHRLLLVVRVSLDRPRLPVQLVDEDDRHPRLADGRRVLVPSPPAEHERRACGDEDGERDGDDGQRRDDVDRAVGELVPVDGRPLAAAAAACAARRRKAVTARTERDHGRRQDAVGTQGGSERVDDTSVGVENLPSQSSDLLRTASCDETQRVQ